jgi:hypothetical protein
LIFSTSRFATPIIVGDSVIVSPDEANGSTYSGKLDMGRSVLMVKPDTRRPPPMGLASGGCIATTPAMVTVLWRRRAGG